ncbi:hypothetical protein SANTM175S_00678 [Streptomyces antimycoticus]
MPGDPPTRPPMEDLHDGAGSLAAQGGKRGLGDVVDAPEVRLELGAEVVVVRCLDGRHIRVSRVVHEHVDAPEAGERRLDGLVRRLGTRDVQRDGMDAVAVLAECLREGLGVAGGGHDMIAGLEGGGDQGAPEAARSTGDEPDLLLHAVSTTPFS